MNKKSATSFVLNMDANQLIELAKCSALTEMSNFFIHEISQPLSIINTYVNGSLRLLNSQPAQEALYMTEALRKASANIETLINLVCDSRKFLGEKSLNKEKFDIHEIINQVIGALQFEIQELDILIQCDFDAAISSLMLDVLKISFVIYSLIKNSIDAMLATNKNHHKIIIKTQKNSLNSILISVIDNGCGFEVVNAKKLFHSNFTTKHEGSGITLIICKRIIEAHHGLITANCLPSSLTQFNFQLPLALKN